MGTVYVQRHHSHGSSTPSCPHPTSASLDAPASAASLNCPEMDKYCFSLSGDLAVFVVGSWQECGQLCVEEPACLYWSLLLGSQCELKPSCDACDGGICDDPGQISGERGCVAK